MPTRKGNGIGADIAGLKDFQPGMFSGNQKIDSVFFWAVGGL